MTELARVDVEHRDDTAIVSIQGEVDISNADEVSKAISSALGRDAKRHVIDLSKTQYLDSVGVRLLFALAEQLGARRQQLHVVVPEDATIRRVLLLADLPKIVPMHASLDAIGLAD